MRVTKAIREYITDEIDEIYEPYFKELKREEADILDLSRKVNDYLKKRVEKFSYEVRNEFLNDFGLEYKDYLNILKFNSGDIKWWIERYSPEAKSLEKSREELNNRRDKAIRDTIAMLELGGTKKELDEVL